MKKESRIRNKTSLMGTFSKSKKAWLHCEEEASFADGA